ncbi:hypothetical protein [Gordonia hydrophobica]|uniref:Uncharacterized protein n=1 Tax=Gordonia hydrophobica TaxID=40516 RepID=A0ABZ2U062_9ACTN|nr:hypothetical protein [Gordonia hydrophobica]MBM7369132.1 hypothetical protein [Gordonia hydrophobica]
MKQPGYTTIRTVVAAVVATVGVVVAVIVDHAAVSALIAAATAVVAIVLIHRIRTEAVAAAVRGALIVTVSILVVGIPAVVLLAPSGAESVADGARVEVADSTDLSAALERSLDRAQEIAPNGAESILRITIDGDSESLYVLNQQNGQMVYSHRSGDSGWYEPRTMSTSQRTVFSRADVRGLNLNATADRVVQTWRTMALDDASGQPEVEVAPRSGDEKLVATFSGGAFPIEADASGNLADTVDAASIDGFLDVARRVMTDAGLDPKAKMLREVAYKSLDDGASWHGRARPGFDLSFDGGPIMSIAVEVGQFPEIRKSTTDREPDGFSLSGLTGATMVSVRDDLARRGSVRHYDRDVIGAAIGVASDDSGPGRVPVTIQMVLGPSSVEVAGVYSTRGRFLRDGVR